VNSNKASRPSNSLAGSEISGAVEQRRQGHWTGSLGRSRLSVQWDCFARCWATV